MLSLMLGRLRAGILKFLLVWQFRHFLVLVSVLAAVALVDFYKTHYLASFSRSSFDLLVRTRLIAPQPDADIVILDIDEKSLAEMAPSVGRWRWSNQVFAETLQALEEQGAKAVVFDMQFSDPDTLNPDSEHIFNETVRNSNIAWFGWVRLDPSNDQHSQLMRHQIPGVEAIGAAQKNTTSSPTIAATLPYMDAIIAKGQIGTLNVVPDKDNIIRQYQYYRDEQGYRIPSLAYQMGKKFGWDLDIPNDVLINWTGKTSMTHQHVSFSDFYLDLQKQNKKRAPDEFKNKIVLIGATAPSLFDNKTTPIAKIHPGVDILATTIDNLKNNQAFGDLPQWLKFGLALFFLSFAAWTQRRGFQAEYNKRFLWAGQFLLLLLSWMSLQWALGSPRFFDLSAPFALGTLFLTLMGLRNKLVQDALEYRGLFKKLWLSVAPKRHLLILQIDESLLKQWIAQYARDTLAYSLQKYPLLPGVMDNAFANHWLLLIDINLPAEVIDQLIQTPNAQLFAKILCDNIHDTSQLQSNIHQCFNLQQEIK